MSPEPEKRSDERPPEPPYTDREKACIRAAGASVRSVLDIATAERDEARAALAASRADNERLRTDVKRQTERADAVERIEGRARELAQERATAAWVKVSQLRAKVDKVRDVIAVALQPATSTYLAQLETEQDGWKRGARHVADRVRAALAEPLGSTPDPPAECPDCAASGFATTRDGRSLGVCDGCGGSGAAR